MYNPLYVCINTLVGTEAKKNPTVIMIIIIISVPKKSEKYNGYLALYSDENFKIICK